MQVEYIGRFICVLCFPHAKILEFIKQIEVSAILDVDPVGWIEK